MQIFPRWTNELPKLAPPVAIAAGVFAVFIVWYWFSPKHTDVGYAPRQPIPYSHKLHAGDLGMDCRYCHTNVEVSAHAGVPPTQTCLNCHNVVRKDSKLLAPLRAAKEVAADGTQTKDSNGIGMLKTEGPSIPWLRIHKVADYAYFDHSAHVTVGVGCKSCHGRIDQMPVVQQVEPLSMGWCLECHRNVRYFEDRDYSPAKVLRPDSVSITDMTYDENHPAYSAWVDGAKEKAKTLRPPTVECTGCHR